MESNSLINLLKSNVVEGRGVVNVRAVLTELDNQKKDAFEEFTGLFHDPEASVWHSYAIVGLQALADRGRLNPEQARVLLEMAETLTRSGGMDREDYLRTIAVHLSVFEPGGQALGNPSPPLFLSFVTEPTRSRCPERS